MPSADTRLEELKEPQPVKIINTNIKRDLLRLDFNLLMALLTYFCYYKYKYKFCAK